MNAVQGENRWSSLQIAGVYIGTIVGAGFASGQEVLRFFSLYRAWGTYGLLISMALLGLYGVAALRLGQRLQAQSHRDLLWSVAGPWLGRAIDFIITGFLFAGTGVMIAGSGAVFQEQFQLPSSLGNIIMAIAAFGTVAFGLKGVVRAVSVVSPLLILTVVIVSAYSLSNVGDWWLIFSQRVNSDGPGLAGVQPASSHWLLSAFLYASYNYLLAVPILAPLGLSMPGADKHWKGGLLGGLGLAIAALAIHGALIARLPEVVAWEVPMLLLAREALPGLTGVYALVLWAEVYTTAVAGLYGVTVRLVPETSKAFPIVAGVIVVAALLLAQLRFSALVVTLYPLVGYAGLLLILVIPWYLWRGRVD